MDAMSGLTGYDQVASLIDNALADAEVKSILMEIDSPGGQANGVFELAARLIQAAAAKPVWGHANENAYSAAYALLCATDRAYAPNTGGVGSIGTIAMHVDQSKRDSMMGYSYTFIYAGAKKADLNSHQPLNESGLAFLEAEVQRVNGMFVSHVADCRGLSAEAVLATEAGLMSPPEALDGGYIDGVATLAETVAMLEAELRNSGFTTGTGMAARRSAASTQRKESQMNTKDEKTAASVTQAGADQPKHTDAQLEAARTEATATATATATAAGRAEGIKAERERVQSILTHAEAKDRPQLAMSVAFETEMTAEQAAKLLAAAPKQAAGSALASLMAGINNPKVGADADVDPGAAKPKIDSAATIYARRRQAA
jgi:ClpP class serine protease